MNSSVRQLLLLVVVLGSASACFNVSCLLKNLIRKPHEKKVILPTPTMDFIRWGQRFFGYSAMAYCPPDELQQKACKYCKVPFFTQGIPDFIPFNQKTLLGGSFQGYLAANSRDKEIIVSFRGTASRWNAVTDLLLFHAHHQDMAEQLSVKLSNTTTVHRGFLGAYSEIKDFVRDTLITLIGQYSDYEISFTGHSLGAALATLAALDAVGPNGYLTNRKNASQVSLVTFGSPRIGNAEFAAVMKNIPFKRIARVVNEFDPVPRVPPLQWSYMHHPGELFIRESSLTANYCDDIFRSGEDTMCATAVNEKQLKVSSHGQYFGLRIDGACIRNMTADREAAKNEKKNKQHKLNNRRQNRLARNKPDLI